MPESNIHNNPSSKEKHAIHLDYFIDLEMSFASLQRILSLINTLALMVTDNTDPRLVPELYFSKIETDSIYITFEADNNFYIRLKNLIKDINLTKTIDQIPKDNYLIPIIKRTYQLYKQKCLIGSKYLLLQEYDIGEIEDFAKFIFTWTRKITAINGKSFESKVSFETKENVLHAYSVNKENLIDSVFSNLSLDHIDLSYANFKGSEFIKTNFMQSTLEHTIFENADLTEANLIGAVLANANLTNANLSTAQLMEADFSEANLTGATLSGTFLIGANMRRCNLSKTNLNSAVIARSDVSRAFFNDCIAPNTNFVGVNATEANFTNANFSNSDFSTARLQGVNISNANFSHVKLLETTLAGITRFDGINFNQSDWWNASDISEELLKYLKHVFPCPHSKEERIKHYQMMYGKDPSENTLKKQNRLLGIKEKQEQPHLDDINLDASQLTPELLAKLADNYLNNGQ